MMFEIDVKNLETTTIVEIKCPVCGSDRVDPIYSCTHRDEGWECCKCGQSFKVNYPEGESDDKMA